MTVKKMLLKLGLPEIVNRLLDDNVDANERGHQGTYGYGTPPAAACVLGKETIVKALIDRDADPQLAGPEGCPLVVSVAYNLVHIVKLLLAMDGMSPDCTRVPHSDHQVTENVKASVLDELSEASAPMVYIAAFYGSTEALDVLLNAGADVNKVGGPHFTILQVASLGGHTDIVKNMLRKGANPQIHGGEWGSALKAALADQKSSKLPRP